MVLPLARPFGDAPPAVLSSEAAAHPLGAGRFTALGKSGGPVVDHALRAPRVPRHGRLALAGKCLTLSSITVAPRAQPPAPARALLRAGGVQVELLVCPRVVDALRAPI